MSTEVQIDTAKLDAIFEPINRGDRPGVAVGVAHKGIPVYRRGFGLASVELALPLSPTIRMRIGSTTKHFGCLAIMLLAEEGKLSVDDSPRRAIPELPDWAERMTLAQLMSHTAGVRCTLDVQATIDGAIGRPVSMPEGAELALLTSLDSANFAPGDRFSYSNGGYTLLTEVIERTSGLSWPEFLTQRILRPVGMHDTMARPVDTDCVPNSATLHLPRPDGGFDKGIFGLPISAAGNIVSTVDDMLKWLAHMSRPVVGNAATWQAMRTPVRLNNGASTGYGYGLMTSEYRGLETLHHGGAVIGGSSQMLKVVAHELDIVVMGNSSGLNPPGLTESVIDACVVGLVEKREPGKGEPLSGDFYARASGRHSRFVAKDGETCVPMGPAAMPLPRDPEGRAMIRVNGLEFAPITATEAGFDLTEFGITDHYERVSPPAEPESPAIAGHYANAGAAATMDVADGDPPTLVIRGAHGQARYTLEALAPGLWLATMSGSAIPMTCTIERDGDALLVSSGRSWRLRFDRAR